MSVAVVIVVAGRDRHLERALGGLACQRRAPGDVIVIEMDVDATTARRRFGVRTVALGHHDRAALPLARARNAGAAAATAGGHDHVLFLDVDCIPAVDMVASYVDALDAHPDALVSGPVRYLDEGWDRGAVNWTDTELRDRSRPPAARPVPAPGTLIEADHELFWSLAFGVTVSTWDRLGGFDEGYIGYGAEDTDFGLRARAASVPLLLVDGGTVFHQWHPPSRHDPALLAGMVANARRFRQRWGTWPMAGWFHELAAAGLVQFDPSADVLEAGP